MPFLYILVKISLWDMLKNLKGAFISSIITGVISMMIIYTTDNMVLQICYALLSAVIYLGIICMMPADRKILFNIKTYLKR